MRFEGVYFSWACFSNAKANFGCHDILILGRSFTRRRQCRDMIIAADWHNRRLATVQSDEKLNIEASGLRSEST